MFQQQLACQTILGTTEPLAWSCGSCHLLLSVGLMAQIPKVDRILEIPGLDRSWRSTSASHQVLDASRLGQFDREARLLLRGLTRVN